MEDPLTDQTHFQPIRRSVYKKPKPTISREKDGNIPGMRDLWDAIDRLAAQVSALKEEKKLGLEYYRKNHFLIQLRQEQFVLKDSVSSVIQVHSAPPIHTPFCYTSDTGYVRDFQQEWVYRKFKAEHYRESFGEEWYWRERDFLDNFTLSADPSLNWTYVSVSENLIDFTNPEHVYQVLELYSTLKQNSWEELDADLKFLLWELEEYIEESDFTPVRKLILERKIDKFTNEQIRRELQEKFGLNYSDNYISTIYKGMICDRISKTAQLSFDSWVWRDHPEKFKICSTCGRRLLRDNRNFVKKQNSKDGLSARCKSCDKQVREKRKEAQNQNGK